MRREPIVNPAAHSEERELRDLLKPVQRRLVPRLKAHELAFTLNDERAFTRVLLENFPRMLFVGTDRLDGRDVATRFGSLCGDVEPRAKLALLPSEGWRWECFVGEDGAVIGRWPRLRFGYISMHHPKWFGPDGRPSDSDMRHGRIWASFGHGDAEKQAFLRKVWRLLPKVSANIVNCVDRDTGRVFPRTKLAAFRVGFDALYWAQGDERRRIEGDIRPTDDWVMPESPYYD